MQETFAVRLENWVRKTVESSAANSRLPTDRELAAMWSISKMTVRRVMDRLSSEGMVVRIRGKGTFTPRADPPDATVLRLARSSEEAIVDQILGSIGKGEIRAGDALPALKNVSNDLRVSPATVARAYAQLRRSGHVVKAGKSFRIASLPSFLRRPHQRDVFLFTHTTDGAEKLFSEAIFRTTFQHMENELIRRGYRLLFELYRDFEPRVSRWSRGARFPQGVICTGLLDGAVGPAERVEVEGKIRHLRSLVSPDHCRALVVVRSMPADQTGALYFSLSHAATAVRRALAVAFAAHGLSSVRFHLRDHPTDKTAILNGLSLLPEMRLLNPGATLTCALQPAEAGISREDFLRQLFANMPFDLLKTRLEKNGNATIDECLSLIELVSDIRQAFRPEQQRTAWVFNDDDSAVSALDWCTANKIAVPGRVSIVSLENNRRYACRGVSTCTFDLEGMGYIMAHTIIGDIPLRLTRRGYVDYNALYVERRTTDFRESRESRLPATGSGWRP